MRMGEVMYMELLKQCQKWHEEDRHREIADILEAIPEEERTREMDLELARAYNNLADPETPEGRELLRRAIALMQPYRDELEEDYSWNFRMGYAYYYLDQEGGALQYFQRARKLHPGDAPGLNSGEEIDMLMDDCRDRLSLPRFEKNFRQRSVQMWNAFLEGEAELRRMMDGDRKHEHGDELIARCDKILNHSFENICFEMGFNGEKYELILTPEGDRVKLFELLYLLRHVPDEVLEHWNILVGRQPTENIGLQINGWEISGDDVRIWVEKLGDTSVGLALYSEKLLPLLGEDENRAWWMLATITDQVLGEIPAMRYIDGFHVMKEPKGEPSALLSELPEILRDMGFDLSTDPESCHYSAYRMEPDESPDADWRTDVIVGSTCCVPLIGEYLDGESDSMDMLHADGAVAGFFCYPLDGFSGEDRTQQIFDFRDRLETELAENLGEDVLTLTGGATGVSYGYVDFIAWDLTAALNKAGEFFAGSGLPWAGFRVFRRDTQMVTLVGGEDAKAGTQESQEEAQFLDKRLGNWKEQEFSGHTAPSKLAVAMMDYLGGDDRCEYFPPMRDDDPITAALSYARREGAREGFLPVLIKVDEILWECLIMNSDPDSDGAGGYAFNPEQVEKYRRAMLEMPVKDGRAVLANLVGDRQEEAEDDDMDWEEMLGEMEGGYANNRFSSYWDHGTDMTYPLILAKIPVKNPWEIFAWLPFGNWNDCPDTPELMAVAKYWAQQYGAVPAVLTHDELEFALPAPVPKEKAMELAVEQYGFCPDMDQNEDSIGALADTLWQSDKWYFWWD